MSFARFIFPWGQKGTFLEGIQGPDKWQEELLLEVGQRMLAAEATGSPVRILRRSGHGVGKALHVDMVLDTPTGPRRFGDLSVGDYVFGKTGEPTKVTGVYPQGLRLVYRVTFSDGSSTLACAEHLWSVRGRQSRRSKRRTFEVKTTEELIPIVSRPNGIARAHSWEIPTAGPLTYSEKEVPVHPYTLAAWLGDGTCHSGQITAFDPEIVERLRSVGNKMKVEPNCPGAYQLSTFGKKARILLGLQDTRTEEKFVPDVYKYNSSAIRWEVLRGLMDTDGTAGKKGCCSFSSTSFQLVKDLQWIVRSLGGIAYGITSRIPTFTYKGIKKFGMRAYQLHFMLPGQIFYIERKQSRLPETVQPRYLTRFITSIKPESIQDTQCITVSACDSLYLANDSIVTHNSAAISMLILWFMSTRSHPNIVVTANTSNQLSTKTWRELSKWHQAAINSHWFNWTATRLTMKESPSDWFAAAIPWSKERSEAFAGTHEARGVLMVMDEASLIEDKIFEVADGAMDAGSLWVAFGNPTRNQGAFYEAAVGRQRHRWFSKTVDARTSKFANQIRIAQWIEDYGIESDYVKVRVLGEFPSTSSLQFIGTDIRDAAAQRMYNPDLYKKFPKVMGVDVARFGDDQSVMIKRQGLQAHGLRKFRDVDVDVFASIVAQEANEWKPDLIAVDATGGYGLTVIFKLKQLGFPVIEVSFGTRAAAPGTYANKRAEIWGRMKDWLKAGGAIPADQELLTDLIAPEYSFKSVKGKDVIILESKEDMKARGAASPDSGDALAMTFAEILVGPGDVPANQTSGVAPSVGEPDGSRPDQRKFIRDVARRFNARR